MHKSWVACLLLISCLWSCGGSKSKRKTLPILGKHTLLANKGGTYPPDTLYHRVGTFRFLNQDSSWVTAATFANKVYVADFFFTSCPTICPIMAKHMLKVYETYKNNPQVGIISHSIDPTYDDVNVLRKYANGLQVSSKTWHFVTGKQADIHDIALKRYFSVAIEDSTAAGGYLHSGSFLLVDNKQRIRGVYDGTSATSVDSLIHDISLLLDELP